MKLENQMHETTGGGGPTSRRHARQLIRPALLLLIATLLLAAGGCAKREVLTGDVNIGDGREFEVKLNGERSLRGRLVNGSTVQYEEGDSLFLAEVDEVNEQFIELSARTLITDRTEWTHLRVAAEDAGAVVERPEVGGTFLARDEIESVTLLSVDRRRILVEAIFWAAIVVTAGYVVVEH
jgi:hypothetical protein